MIHSKIKHSDHHKLVGPGQYQLLHFDFHDHYVFLIKMSARSNNSFPFLSFPAVMIYKGASS